jgi:hypothetical protein
MERRVRMLITWASGYAPQAAVNDQTYTIPMSEAQAKQRARSYGDLGMIIAIGIESLPDPRDSEYSRPGLFSTHNCWRCKNGAELCIRGYPSRCEYPYARND